MFDSFRSTGTVAHYAPLSMGFSREEYWSGLPFPTPGDLPDSGMEPMSPASLHWQADSLPLSLLVMSQLSPSGMGIVGHSPESSC